MSVTSLKGHLMFILFLYSNVVESYREIEVRELIYFSNPFSHLRNK